MCLLERKYHLDSASFGYVHLHVTAAIARARGWNMVVYNRSWSEVVHVRQMTHMLALDAATGDNKFRACIRAG